MPFQGGNASITKYAMVLIRNKILEKNWDLNGMAKVLCAVHDEILVEAHDDVIDEMHKIQVDEMLAAAYHYVKKVPMAVETSVEGHWVK
jgi:DNA polymerase-1